MAFLSSLFQTGAPLPQVAGPTIATQKLPEEIAPYYKDIMSKAQALYKEKTAEGYQPYQGPTIAEFSPEQQQAFTGIAGLAGQGKPVFDEAMGMTRGAAAPITGEQITEYMSPYQQAVTDIEKRESQKAYESQVQPQLAAQAAQAQAFGGSRQGILEGMAADTQQRLLADIQAKGSQQAYQEAIRRLEAERTRTGQAGAQLATMVPQALKTQLGEFGALQTIGEEKQQQTQTALDEAYRQYALEQNYPYDVMSKYQSVVTGAPMGETRFAQPAARTPSIGQQLLGGLGTIAGTYGAFGGKLPNIFGKKQGGGLSDLPIIHAKDGDSKLRKYFRYLKEQSPASGLIKWGGLLGGPSIADIAEKIPKARPEVFSPEEAFRRGGLSGPKIVQSGDAPGPFRYEERTDEPSVRGLEETTIVPIRRGEPESLVYGREYDPAISAPLPEHIEQELAKVQTREAPYFQEDVPALPFKTKAPVAPELLPIPTEPGGRIPSSLDLLARGKDIDIRKSEEAYMKNLADKQARFDVREAGLGEERTRAQWANLAQLFSRIGTATPRMEGLSGVLDVAMREAPESIKEMQAINKEIRERREAIQDKREDLKSIQVKEELGIKLSRKDRLLKAGERREEKRRFDLTLEVAQKEAKAAWLAANLPDDVKDIYLKRIDNSDSFIKDMKFWKSEDGSLIIQDGKLRGKDSILVSNITTQIDTLKAAAEIELANPPYNGNYAAWASGGGMTTLKQNIHKALGMDQTITPLEDDAEITE